MDTGAKHDLSAELCIHLDRRYRERSRTRRFQGSGKEELLAWQARTRRELAAALGGEPDQVPALALERIPIAAPDAPEFAGVRLERLYYRTREDLTATAFLVLPAGLTSPAPAVLCPPGHGGGMNQLVFEPGIYHHYPLHLARRGLVSLVPEHLGHGERAVPQAPGCTHAFSYLAPLVLGENAMGYLLWDLRRALSVLAGLPEVDPARLGCFGLSLGGEMTMFTAALDQRVQVAGISGFFTSYRSTYLHEQHCGCGYVPGIACLLEHVDIAALVAPRPLLIESGTADPSFRTDVTREQFQELQATYQQLGAADRLELHVFPGGHEVGGELPLDWLAARLA